MKNFGTILFLIATILMLTAIIKYLWTYLVERLFPGAVEQNLVAKEISWKVSIILAVIFALIIQN